MRTPLSRIATLLMVAATGAGCGDSGSPSSNALTTVEVTPATATLFTVAPGTTVKLSVVGKDQSGQAIADAGSPSFSSDNSAIADVSGDGTVTAVAEGTAHITASLTAGGVTKTGSTTVTALVAPVEAAVSTVARTFLPGTVDVQAGGTVTWSIGGIHNVSFITGGAPANIPSSESSGSRTFLTPGVFLYECTIHDGMHGMVRVH